MAGISTLVVGECPMVPTGGEGGSTTGVAGLGLGIIGGVVGFATGGGAVGAGVAGSFDGLGGGGGRAEGKNPPVTGGTAPAIRESA